MTVNPYSKLDEKGYTLFRVIFQNIVVFLLSIKLRVKYKYKVEGLENIPPKSFGSYIVAANHTSDLDPPIVSVALRYRNISYMTKEELFSTPFKAWLYSELRCFSVNRQKLEMSTIRSAKTVINSGKYLLGMFPEGTRKSGGFQEVKKGVAFIAKATKASILPIGISRSGKDGRNILAKIGKLVPYEEDIDALSQKIQTAISELLVVDASDATTGESEQVSSPHHF